MVGGGPASRARVPLSGIYTYPISLSIPMELAKAIRVLAAGVLFCALEPMKSTYMVALNTQPITGWKLAL